MAVVPGTAAAQVNDPPAHIAVSASLGSCDGGANNRVCKISVSFGAIAGASRYETTISAPDGSNLVQAAGEPGGATYSVPYRGNGTYRVVVTAFGARSR